MGKSGFTIIESGSTALNATTNMVTDFQLPDDWPENLMTFLQIHLALTELTTILIIRDGTSYPLETTTASFIGEVYRSIPIEKGEIVNVQFGTTQTILKFKFSLEE